jgi:hypothetical protein
LTFLIEKKKDLVQKADSQCGELGGGQSMELKSGEAHCERLAGRLRWFLSGSPSASLVLPSLGPDPQRPVHAVEFEQGGVNSSHLCWPPT